jgi:hypothetical protein
MNPETKLKFEWAYFGAVRDFEAYVRINTLNVMARRETEIPGIFLNKFKTRLRDAFGDLKELSTVKSKDFTIKMDINITTIHPEYELKSIKFECETRHLYNQEGLIWYLHFYGNKAQMVNMLENLGDIKDYLSKHLCVFAPETEIVDPDYLNEPLFNKEIDLDESWPDGTPGIGCF